MLDPFAGSNTTGAVAEQEKRRWLAFEAEENYLVGSKFRFPQFSGGLTSSQVEREETPSLFDLNDA